MITVPVELKTDKTDTGFILVELIIGGKKDIGVQLVVPAQMLLDAARKIVPEGRVSMRRKL